MAFPDDYHLNITICPVRLRHQWSSTGHPLKHTCVFYHRPKWIETDPLRTAVR